MSEPEKLDSRHVVCLSDVAKTRRQRKPDDPGTKRARQRKYRLLKQAKANPHKPWHDHCHQCNRPIKLSQHRMFCKGGGCKKAFGAALRGPSAVLRVVPIKHQISSPLMEGDLSLLPVKESARVMGAPRWDSPKRRHGMPATGMLSALFPNDEPLFAIFSPSLPNRTWKEPEVIAVSVLFPFDEPLFTRRLSDWFMQPKWVTKVQAAVRINPLSREEASVRRPLLFPPCEVTA